MLGVKKLMGPKRLLTVPTATHQWATSPKPLAASDFLGTEWNGPFGKVAVTMANTFFGPKVVRFDPNSEQFAVEAIQYACSREAFPKLKGYKHLYVAKKFFTQPRPA